MLRTKSACCPCAAISQNVAPITPLPTGVCRALPVRRPVVSRSAYVLGASPRRSAQRASRLCTRSRRVIQWYFRDRCTASPSVHGAVHCYISAARTTNRRRDRVKDGRFAVPAAADTPVPPVTQTTPVALACNHAHALPRDGPVSRGLRDASTIPGWIAPNQGIRYPYPAVAQSNGGQFCKSERWSPDDDRPQRRRAKAGSPPVAQPRKGAQPYVSLARPLSGQGRGRCLGPARPRCRGSGTSSWSTPRGRERSRSGPPP